MYKRIFLVLCCTLICLVLWAEDTLSPSATVFVPMRDGLELPADLYYPPASSVIGNDYPCILLRVPAGRAAQPWQKLAELSKHGYVIAIQDTRSALDPEGKTLPYLSDGWDIHQDGYDTVEWLSKSSFTNGKIGTLGFSAAGVTQLMLAPTAPSALKCQYIGQAAASLYHHAIYHGGQLHKHQVESWLGYYAPHSSVLMLVTSQPFYNDFWKKVDTVSVAHRVDVAGLHYTGWFDTFLQGTIDAFVARQEKGQEGARGSQKLVIGPWNHYWPRDLSLGDFQLPENGREPPVDVSMQRWFDYYLKDTRNGVEGLPAVTYYVMGPFDGTPSSGNAWKHAEHWPVPSVATPLFLTGGKSLSWIPEKKEERYTFESDPSNPVPTIGGRNLFLESGPKDQRPIEKRQDVLVFTAAPLEEDLEVTGHILAKLYFASDAMDTDVAVRLTDVYPDGKSVLISDGLCRIGRPYAQSNEASGKIQEVTVDLSSTSIVFAKGHAIRISVAGSNYPRYEKNNNVGLDNADAGHFLIARNIVYAGENTPSRLILPVVRRGNKHLIKQSQDSQVLD